MPEINTHVEKTDPSKEKNRCCKSRLSYPSLPLPPPPAYKCASSPVDTSRVTLPTHIPKLSIKLFASGSSNTCCGGGGGCCCCGDPGPGPCRWSSTTRLLRRRSNFRGSDILFLRWFSGSGDSGSGCCSDSWSRNSQLRTILTQEVSWVLFMYDQICYNCMKSGKIKHGRKINV